MMKENIAKTVICAIAFVCITVIAIYFKNSNILWWYLLPGLIAID